MIIKVPLKLENIAIPHIKIKKKNFLVCLKYKHFGAFQDGGEIRGGDHLSAPQICQKFICLWNIQNTS